MPKQAASEQFLHSEEEAKKMEAPDQDYHHLESLKREIFLKLENVSIPLGEREALIGRIYQNSIEDGEEIADFLCLSAGERALMLYNNDKFVGTHPDFARRLKDRLKEYWKIDDPDEIEINTASDALLARLNWLKSDLAGDDRKRAFVNLPAPVFHKDALSLMKEIDDYYDQFRILRELKEVDATYDARTRGQRLGENVLNKQEKMLGEHYYTGPIKDLLRDSRGEVNIPFLYGNTISRKDLESSQEIQEVLRTKGMALDDGNIKKLLEKARYQPLDVVYHTEHDLAERQLKKEITTSIKGRGYKDGEVELIFDERTGTYKIESHIERRVTPGHKKESSPESLKPENLKLIDTFDTQIRVDLESPEMADLKRCYGKWIEKHPSETETYETFSKLEVGSKIIDGELYRKSYVVGYYNGFITSPDGTKSKILGGLDHTRIVKQGGVVQYDYKDIDARSKNRVMHYGEVDLSNEERYFASTVLRSNGSLYWIGAGLHNDYNRSDDPKDHVFSLMVDGKIERNFVCSHIILAPEEIQGEVVYQVYNQNLSGHFYIYKGNQTFGPYLEADIDFQSKEELVFCAKDINNNSILFYDGEEHTTPNMEFWPRKVHKIGDEIYTIYTNSSSSNRPVPDDNTDSFIADQDGNAITEKFATLAIKSEVTTGLCFVARRKEEKDLTLYYDHEPVYKFGGITQPKLGVFNGEVACVITNGAKNEIRISDLKRSEIVVTQEATEYGLECEIKDDHILISFRDIHERWQIYKYEEGFTLSKSERQDIELLNAMEAQSPEAIDGYFKRYYPEETEKGLMAKIKGMYSHSKAFAMGMGAALKEDPALFRDSIAAKQEMNTDDLIDSMIARMFPNVVTNMEKVRKAAKKNKYSNTKKGSSAEYLRGDSYQNEFLDGDPKDAESSDILHLREPISEFLSTGVYGACEGRYWQQVGFPISEKQFGPTKEITAEMSVPRYMKEIILPRCLDARILPERVKGVTANGEEILLETKFNILGEARVDIPKGIEKVLYSQTMQELPVVPEDLDDGEYAHFKANYERRFGPKISEKLARLPEELRIFVSSLKGKSPIEKLEDIESFVKEIGYYDFDNGEVQADKQNKTLEELFGEMAGRMKDVKRKSYSGSGKKAGGRVDGKTGEQEIGDKKYAGVCSDFAKLTTALLREAGFISGIAGGFQPDGQDTTITTKDAHAISYVLWPAENDKAKIITLDGTPNGMNEEEDDLLKGMRQKSLKDRMRLFKDQKEKVMADADAALEELEDLVSRMDVDSIKLLQNGKLEQALNIILSKVRGSHLTAVENVLNASRYGRINITSVMEGADLAGEIAFRKYLELEISRERDDVKEGQKKDEIDYFKGGQLLRVVEEFADRYARDKEVGTRAKALDVVERVFDMSRKFLDPTEVKSVAAVVTYLRAKKMS